MNTILWVLQVLVGIAFIGAGFNYGFRQQQALQIPLMAWMKALSSSMLTFIGVAEILGGIGLILPALTNILPVLTPLAGVGLALIMLLAIIFHARRGEMPPIVFNLILGVLAAFVAYGRFVLVQFV